MNIRRPIWLAAIIVTPVSLLWFAPVGRVLAATPEPDATNSRVIQLPASARVQQMTGVTILELQTDRPLHEARVIVNGAVLGSFRVPVEDKQTKLKLGVVVSSAQNNVTVYLDVGHYGTDFTTSCPRGRAAFDAGPLEKYGSEKIIKLPNSGWIEVYGISEKAHEDAEITHFELKVEIR